MKKLIVNADDYGLTTGVCDGIIKSHKEGIVTSTTVLVNSPRIEEALAKLKQCSSVDLGLHLNITWGKPVLPAERVKTLVDESGLFIRNKNYEKVDPAEVDAEWKAQIEKAKSLGLKLTHLDTHHHTHLHPALLDLLADIAKSQKLAVRSPSTWARDFLLASGIPTTDHFIIDFYGEEKTGVESLQNMLRFLPDGFVEVMCHPAIVDDELKKISSYGEPRAREVETLTSRELKEWLETEGIALSRFSELPIPSAAPEKSCDLIPPRE